MSKREIKIFLTFFLIYSFFAQWNDVWDADAIFSLTRAIVDENRFEIDSFMNLTPIRYYYNGHHYSTISFGHSFVSTSIYMTLRSFFNLLPKNFQNEGKIVTYYIEEIIPSPLIYIPEPSLLVEASRLFLTIFTVSLPAALSVILVYKTTSLLVKNERYKFLTTIAYGLGTSIFPYGISFYHYALVVFFLFSTFYLLLRERSREGNKKALFLAGIINGFAGTTYEAAIPFGILFLVYTYTFNRKGSMTFLLGFLLGILPRILYIYSLFGGFLRIPLLSSRFEASLWNPPKEAQQFSYQIPLRLLIFPYRGIFFYYPLLLLSLLGLPRMMKEKKTEGYLVLLSFLFFLIFYSYFSRLWFGDLSFGPRRFVLLMPFLVLPLVYAFDKVNSKIALLFIFISIFINVLGLQVWEGLSISGELYLEKMKKWQPMGFPLFERYLPLFLENGPRSILFENLILNEKIDITLAPNSCGLTPEVMRKMEIPLFSLPSIGIIALRIPFLCLVPLGIVIFLIWKKEIIGKMNLSRQEGLCMLFILVLIFILSFIKVEAFLYGDNWHASEFHDGKINENERWVSQDATLILFNKNEGKEKTNLIFEIGAFNKTRTLELYLNDKLIGKYDIYDKKAISQEMELEPGENVVKFHSVSGCDRPTELGLADCDLRCLSFKIGNIRTENLDKYLIR